MAQNQTPAAWRGNGGRLGRLVVENRSLSNKSNRARQAVAMQPPLSNAERQRQYANQAAVRRREGHAHSPSRPLGIIGARGSPSACFSTRPCRKPGGAVMSSAEHSETDVKPGADQERLISTIRAHIAKGDHASKKAEQHYIAAGQHLATLKASHAGTWKERETLLRAKLNISTGRASELMQIADGRKTLDQVRDDTNRRKIEHRKVPSFRNEEDEPIKTNETKIRALLQGADRARRCARFDGVPNQEVIEAVRRTAVAWSDLLSGMVPSAAKTGDGRCSWVDDDGGREASGIANAA